MRLGGSGEGVELSSFKINSKVYSANNCETLKSGSKNVVYINKLPRNLVGNSITIAAAAFLCGCDLSPDSDQLKQEPQPSIESQTQNSPPLRQSTKPTYAQTNSILKWAENSRICEYAGKFANPGKKIEISDIPHSPDLKRVLATSHSVLWGKANFNILTGFRFIIPNSRKLFDETELAELSSKADFGFIVIIPGENSISTPLRFDEVLLSSGLNPFKVVHEKSYAFDIEYQVNTYRIASTIQFMATVLEDSPFRRLREIGSESWQLDIGRFRGISNSISFPSNEKKWYFVQSIDVHDIESVAIKERFRTLAILSKSGYLIVSMDRGDSRLIGILSPDSRVSSAVYVSCKIREGR